MNFAHDQYDAVVSEINMENVKQGLDYFSGLHRYSGSIDGEKASHYLHNKLVEYGIPAKLLTYKLYRSLPLPSKVVASGKSYEVTPYVYSGDCNELQAPFYYDTLNEDNKVSINDPQRFNGMQKRIVITRDNTYDFGVRAHKAGALAVLTVWPKQIAHHGTLGSVWGNPEPKDLLLNYPDIPFAEILSADAKDIIEALKKGETITGSLTVRMDTGVVTSSMPFGYISGRSDKFILVSCHYESWYEGMTDNGAADIAVLELARIFNQHKDQLNRSILFAFWSGHSDGRYAGSTWFFDNYWFDLMDRCVAHVNMDIAGCKNSDVVLMDSSCLETDQFSDYILSEFNRVPVKAMPMRRMSDQTFYGVHVPLSFFPIYTISSSGRQMAFDWWHTKEDTIDKVDLDVLKRDTKVIAKLTCAIAFGEALPIDLVKFVDFMCAQLNSIKDKLNDDFQLDPIPQKLLELKDIFVKYQGVCARKLEDSDSDVINIAGILTRLTYTYSDKYHHDPALNQLPFPGLRPAVDLNPGSCSALYYLAVKTQFVRQKNMLLDELNRVQQECKMIFSEID